MKRVRGGTQSGETLLSAILFGASRVGLYCGLPQFCLTLVYGLAVLWPFAALRATAQEAAEPDGNKQAEALLFKDQVEPLLRRHCLECHSSDKKRQAGLAIDSRKALLVGGDTGPAIDLSQPKQSLLLQAVRHENELAMPPNKQLSPGEIDLIERWISLGAPYASDDPLIDVFEQRVQQAAAHWAFKPLRQAEPPQVKAAEGQAWVRNDIDRYILAKLHSAGLEPAPQADRVTLIRRLSFDLLGLPPSPEEVERFIRDDSPNAWESLIDRYLASPHYGERWGRHWLDLARYADSSGFHNDLDRPFAWKYRDWVIKSFNDDKPYADFVAQQLAGDEIVDADDQSLIATGFCRNGPSNDDNMGKSEAALKQYRADQLDDVVSTTSAVFLGVTIGCARCHDHKTDPFSAKDYYSLTAIFNGTEKFGLVPGTKDAKGKKLEDAAPAVHALIESKSTVPPTFVMRRGNASNLGEEVAPNVPSVLPGGTITFPTPEPDAKSSRRRLTFANWITAPENALAWRVLANRIWQYHFGQGLVTTPSNFGFTSDAPTHPELLDYLAERLIAEGGRWKPIHKLIALSATYQQSVRRSSEAAATDPSNRLLSHMNLRRMEAEVIRDSILSASGKLNLEQGGPGIKPRLPAELIPASQRNKWPAISVEEPKHWKRSVYIYSKRQLLMPMMELFDAPTTTDSCACRTQSNVPTQALVLMNDEFVETQAEFLARRASGESIPQSPSELRTAIEQMFRLTVGEVPDVPRLRQAEAFVTQREAASDRMAALVDLAHVLFNSSQFVTVP